VEADVLPSLPLACLRNLTNAEPKLRARRLGIRLAATPCLLSEFHAADRSHSESVPKNLSPHHRVEEFTATHDVANWPEIASEKKRLLRFIELSRFAAVVSALAFVIVA